MRAVAAVVFLLPGLLVINYLIALLTYWSLMLTFGCFAPEGAVGMVALLEFVLLSLAGVLQIFHWVLTGQHIEH